MKIALAQINPTIGDFEGNARLIVENARRADRDGADVVAFPELSLVGYPPRDLVEKPSFLERSCQWLREVAGRTAELRAALIVGYVGRADSESGKLVTNSAAWIERGAVRGRQDKMLLPTYDVFDEARYFAPARRQHVWEMHGVRVGLSICEDSWNDKQYWRRPLYERDPVGELAEQGARILISINASPWHRNKRSIRRDIFASLARRHRLPVAYVNQVGGNDQLIFDGTSFVFDSAGNLAAQAPSFRDDLVFYDTESGHGDMRERSPDSTEAVYEALVLGTRDYLRKCGFSRVLIGLSGGMDSSLVAVIAAEAVGRDNVTGVAMPGPYSSEGSLRDARALAQNLGIRFETIPIVKPYQTMIETLAPVFGGLAPDITEENIQARLRGLTLMALSNKWQALVLTTGNKSEMAVGYCTLYGDMSGGLAVISDVPKTLVYQVARVANRRHPGAIPETVFEKAPSAELRPNQKDTDSLPEYEVLDRILAGYVEEFRSPAEIAEEHDLPLELVRKYVNMVDRNEYKRQQAAPGLKVTSKAFGLGRRLPIAQKFLE